MFDYVVALTGAGISKASGIPTFKDTPGIREKLTLEFAKSNPDEHEAVLEYMRGTVSMAKPNGAHIALAKHKVPIITMNVDGLHQKAGSSVVYEIHGSLEKNNVVLYGESIIDFAEALDLVRYPRGNKNVLLVIGTSLHTEDANEIIAIAISHGMCVTFIEEDAEHKVGEWLENNRR